MSDAQKAQGQGLHADRQGAGRPGARRSIALAAALVMSLGLAACSGGGSIDIVPFDIGVVVGGQALSGVSIAPGGVQTISIVAGQSIELDASEPVDWTLEVGGSAISGNATVYYAGAAITQTAVSPSRIMVDTFASAPLAAPVLITFVATSTQDAAQVATVNVWITN